MTTIALRAFDEAALRRLLHHGWREDRVVEFKQEITAMKPAQTLRELTALANGEADDFVVGTTDEDHELVGIEVEHGPAEVKPILLTLVGLATPWG